MPRTLTPDRCARDVMDAVPLVMRFVRGEMRGHGALSVSVPQFRVLNFVSRHPKTSLTAVAAHLGVTAATASVLVERLVRRGLIARTAHPQERRRVTLTLTRLGTRRFAQARSTTRRRVARNFVEMSAVDLRTISAGSKLLARVFRE